MKRQSSLFTFILVLVLTVPLSAVTVNSLCPTNKIAPHRRISRSWDLGYQGRTLGAFYDLLTPGPEGTQGYNPSLQEEPQKDDLDDCGDIEDYDENDLSSLSPHYQNSNYNQYNPTGGRLFFGSLNQHPTPQRPQYPSSGNSQYPQQPQYPQNIPQYPQNRPQYPQNRPQYPQNRPQYPQNRPQYPQNRPQQSQQSTRPPYASGGYFENNPYRPPIQHYPSDDIKPVYDGVNEPQTTYRPHVIGGPSGHVVGVTQRPRPTIRPEYQTTPNYVRYPTTRSPDYDDFPTRPNYDRYPQPTTQLPYRHTTRQTRPRQLSDNNESILGSFLDLLF